MLGMAKGNKMKKLICEMCGSNDLLKEDGIFVCQTCGCKYSVEEAKKMMIEGTVEVTGKVDVSGSTIKIDEKKQIENLYIIARRALDVNDIDVVIDSYTKITKLMPNDWEAYYFSNFYVFKKELIKSKRQCELNNNIITGPLSFYAYYSDVKSSEILKKNIDVTCQLISKSSLSIEQKKKSYLTVYNSLYELTVKDFSNWKIRNNVANESDKFFHNLTSPYLILASFLHKDTADNEKTIEVCRAALGQKHYLDDEEIKRIEEIIKNCGRSIDEPIFKNRSSSEGCYIATAIYGSYDCPEVWTLRRYRDNQLAQTWYGRLFIYTYYAISPTIVKWFGDTGWFKKMWKGKLDKMVSDLQSKGIESTPYVDRNW